MYIFANQAPSLSFRGWGIIGTGKDWCSKLIGNGLYLKNGCRVCPIETDTRGFYLGPTSGKEFETVGNGVYLMRQGGLYDGRGLILGLSVHLKIYLFLL